MFKFNRKDPTIKIIWRPVGVITLFSFLIFFLINYSYPIIQKNITALNESQALGNRLRERTELLKVFREGVLDESTEHVYIVLPDRNSSALMISQVKAELSAQNTTLRSVEVTSVSQEEDIKNTEIVYKFGTDDFFKPLNTILTLRESAPISSLKEVKLVKDTNGDINSEIKTVIYWSELPKKLPSINEPALELSSNDQEVLTRVLKYRFPDSNNLQPTKEDTRVNPFN